MGNNCCVSREKESEINKKQKQAEKVSEDKQRLKSELQKHEDEETAQTIEFRIDTDGSADIMDMHSKRLS